MPNKYYVLIVSIITTTTTFIIPILQVRKLRLAGVTWAVSNSPCQKFGLPSSRDQGLF